MILGTITGAQAKVPVEALYLETGTLSIKCVITVRRMTILDRHDEEIIKKIYIEMIENPLKNDWYH